MAKKAVKKIAAKKSSKPKAKAKAKSAPKTKAVLAIHTEPTPAPAPTPVAAPAIAVQPKVKALANPWADHIAQANITKPFFNVNGTVYRTSDGKGYRTPEEFFADGGKWSDVHDM